MASVFNQPVVPDLTSPNAGPRVSLYLAAPHLGSAFHQNGIPKLGSPNPCLPYPFGLAESSVSPVAREDEEHDRDHIESAHAMNRPEMTTLLSDVEHSKENNGEVRPRVQDLDCLEGPPGTATNASAVEVYDDVEYEPRNIMLPSSPPVLSVDDVGDNTFVGLKDNYRTWTSDDSDVDRVHRHDPLADSSSHSDNEAAAIALPSSNPTNRESSLSENSFALSAANVSVGYSDDEALASPTSESPSPKNSNPSTIADFGGCTSHTSYGLNLDHANRLDTLVLRSPTTCQPTEGSCPKHDGKAPSSPNTSLQVWSMPEEDGAIYLDNFLKHHFFSQSVDSTTWVLDQEKHTEPAVLHNVTKPGLVFSKSRKVPGLKACSAGAGAQGVVVLGWDVLAVWRRASGVNVSSYSKSSGMYILETARKFELAMYSYLAGLRPKTPTEDLKHFHGTYLVHCSLARKGWENHAAKDWDIGGDIELS